MSPAELFLGWDHLEFWVGNARQAAQFLASGFGFEIVAYAGPETGVPGRASYVLDKGSVRFVVSGGLHPSSEIAAHVKAHGDGVRDVAIAVTDAAAAYERALARGAVGLKAPWIEEDDTGKLVRATVATYGDTQHTFVERSAYSGLFAPGYSAEGLPPVPFPAAAPVPLEKIDHVVANVEKGALDGWVSFYQDVMGFDQLVHFDDEQISTEYSALMSTVVWDGSSVVLPIKCKRLRGSMRVW